MNAYEEYCKNNEANSLPIIDFISRAQDGENVLLTPIIVQGTEDFGNHYHPSLFSFLDEYQRSAPQEQQMDFDILIQYLFYQYFSRILEQRKEELPETYTDLRQEINENLRFYRYCNEQGFLDITFNMPPSMTDRIRTILRSFDHVKNSKILASYELLDVRTVYQSKCKSLYDELELVKDRNRIPQILSTELTNGMLYHLDKLSSRENSRQFLNFENIQLPFSLPYDAIDNEGELEGIKGFLRNTQNKAALNRLGLLKKLCEVSIEFIEKHVVLSLKEFDGDYVQGLAGCSNCSMVFASNTLVSLDSTCKFLYEYGPGWVYLPAKLNYIACPFCKKKAKVDMPAMFHSLDRKQTIYCIPSAWSERKKEGIETFSSFFTERRNLYKKHLTPQQISTFDRSSEIYAFGWNEFIYAIQMGHVETEGHVANTYRGITPEGDALLLDTVKRVAIGLPQEYVQTAEALDETSILEKNSKFNEAMELYKSGRVLESKEILEKLLEKNPNDRSINANLAIILHALGEEERSRSIFERLSKNVNLAGDFQERSSYLHKGWDFQDSGKYEQAIKCFDAAISLNPDYVLALDSKGYCLFRLERYEEAIKCYNRVIEIDRKDFWYDKDFIAWINKGAALSRLGRYEEAIGCYDKVLEMQIRTNADKSLFPSYLVWHNNGVTLARLGKYKEAVELFDKALEIDPKHSSSWYGRARSKIKMGDVENGLMDLRKAIELNNEFVELAKQEQDFEEIRNDKQFKEEVKKYDTVISADVSQDHSNFRNHTSTLSSKSYEAIETMRYALKVDPALAEAHYGNGVTLARLGKYKEAVELFDKALEIDPKHSSSWYGRARSKIKMGDVENGLMDLRKAIELNNEFVELAKQEQDFEEIRNDKRFKGAVVKYDNSILIINRAGIALARLGKYKEAVELFDKALEIDPKHSSSWYGRARSKIKMGDVENGLMDLRKAIELNNEFVELAKQEQDFEEIRNDSRFKELIKEN